MFRLHRFVSLATILVGSTLGSAVTPLFAQGIEVSTALKGIPDSTNSLAIVKIQQLVNSPLGKKEEWAKKHQTQFMAGAVHIPPSVDYIIRGFEFHPETPHATRSYGIAAMKTPVEMSRMAGREKSRVEMIAKHAAVHTERNTYFAQLSPGLICGVSPDYRQDLARWLREIDRGVVYSLSTYLTEAAALSSQSQIVLALDFQDLVDPKRWTERIKSSPALAEKPNAITTLIQLAPALRGVSLSISVTDTTTAVVSLDFSTVVSQTAVPFLKPILIDLLEEAGASLEDLENGEVTAKDKTATISFALSDSGLRQVMSMILMPTLAEPTEETVAANSPTGTPDAGRVPGANLRASQHYYASVNQVLADLEKMAQKGTNYNRTATWHDTFAKKIEQLEIRGVDRELLEYGMRVSSNLRALAVSLRGVPIEVNQLQGAISYNVQYQPSGYYNTNGSIWGTVAYHNQYLNVETNQSEIRAQQAQAIANGAKQREQIWQFLAADRQKIRVSMLEKFGRDFEILGK